MHSEVDVVCFFVFFCSSSVTTNTPAHGRHDHASCHCSHRSVDEVSTTSRRAGEAIQRGERILPVSRSLSSVRPRSNV